MLPHHATFAEAHVALHRVGPELQRLAAVEKAARGRPCAVGALVRSLFRKGICLLDVQFATEHLTTLGVQQCSRREHLDRLAAARDLIIDLTDLTPSV